MPSIDRKQETQWWWNSFLLFDLFVQRTINVDKETWIKRYKNQWIIFHFKAPDISTSWEYFFISFITHLNEMMPMLLHHPWCWSIYYSKWNNIKSKFHHTHVVNHIFCCPFSSFNICHKNSDLCDQYPEHHSFIHQKNGKERIFLLVLSAVTYKRFFSK